MTRLGGVAAFAAGFVGALVVVGLAARSRLTPQGEAVQRRLTTEGAALKAATEAYAARERVRLDAYGHTFAETLGRVEADLYAAELGIPQIKTDLVRLQGAIAARKAQLIARGAQAATLVVEDWNPFNLIR